MAFHAHDIACVKALLTQPAKLWCIRALSRETVEFDPVLTCADLSVTLHLGERMRAICQLLIVACALAKLRITCMLCMCAVPKDMQLARRIRGPIAGVSSY